MNDIINFLVVTVIVIALLDIGLTFFSNNWYACKRRAIKRRIWLTFGFCPRCNCRVNFTRNGSAVCPECGRRA